MSETNPVLELWVSALFLSFLFQGNFLVEGLLSAVMISTVFSYTGSISALPGHHSWLVVPGPLFCSQGCTPRSRLRCSCRVFPPACSSLSPVPESPCDRRSGWFQMASGQLGGLKQA